MKISSNFQQRSTLILATFMLSLSSAVWAHGNVTPQSVDTSTLPVLGTVWKSQNPYTGNEAAIKVGTSAFNQNCARCHGLEAISGGIAPDLRRLDNECATLKDAKKQTMCAREIDDFFIGKFRKGVSRNGAVYMPPFEGILNQEAAWSIKSYLETRREKPLAAAK